MASPSVSKIIPGSTVRMHFSLALLDGTEAMSSFAEEPLTFTLGDGTLSEGLEHALYGLREGERQTLRIDGDYVYGARDEDNVHLIGLERFPADITPEAGLIVAFQGPDGEAMAGRIIDIADGQARVDFNHPLAGREVVFTVEILRVSQPALDVEE